MSKEQDLNSDWIDLENDPKFNWSEGDLIISPPKDKEKER
jgi:hypothetical protein